MRFCFQLINDARAKDRHGTQYFEIVGNRGVYHDGWLAGTVHRAVWESVPRASLDKDKWELYDTRTDFSLADDVAAKFPGKLKEMQDLFMAEAIKYRVLPIDDRIQERMNAAIAGRPDLMAGRTSLTVYDGMIDPRRHVQNSDPSQSLLSDKLLRIDYKVCTYPGDKCACRWLFFSCLLRSLPSC